MAGAPVTQVGFWGPPSDSGTAAAFDVGTSDVTTSSVFTARGKLAFLAELARGAYHLRDDAQLGDGIDSNETPGLGFSEDPKADASFVIADQYLDMLDPADFGAVWEGPLGLYEDFFGYVNGLENGIFTSANAAALIARSDDALFIAFRGSNDTLDFIEDATNLGRANHWDEFAALRTAITDYINDAANGISKVYVTGHSLGGAMAQAMMTEHAGDARFEAATFGSIGFGSGANGADARIVNMANDGDPATQFPIVSRNNGDMNVVVDQLPYGTTTHSMSLYYEISRFLTGEGYDFDRLGGVGGFDFDSIAVGAHDLGDNAFSVGNLAEIVLASAAADLILGGEGNDSLSGFGGNDLAVGGTGDDRLFGGSGDDTLDGGAGSDGLFGEIGIDVLFGGAGLDFILGGADDDVASGGDDRDLLYGEAGLDVLFGDGGDDFLAGGAARDWLYSGTGLDVLFGGDGDDVLSGDADRDWVYGEAGLDLLFGGDGDDVVAGGAGADTVIGGAGADALFGEAGNDFIFAETGNDFVVGGAGYNQISLAGGLDIVLSTNGDGGTQYVVDFSVADGDQVWLVGSGYASAAAALASAVNVGGATYIGNGNDAVYLAGIAPSQLSAGNIVLL